MTRLDIEQAVARVTGESRRLIRRYGFSLLDAEPETSEEPLLVLDCPGCGAPLNASNSSTELIESVECPRCDAVFPFAVEEVYVADGSNVPLAACA